jgi:methylsterol monooxygenase
MSEYDFITAPFFAHIITYWVFSGFFALLDYVVERKGLLWLLKTQGKRIEKEGGIDWLKYYNTAWGSLLNQLGVFFPMLLIAYPINLWLETPIEPIPKLSLTYWWKMGWVILYEDIFFYYGHRLLHTPYLYEKVHKIHHTWPAPVGCRALFCHPFEHFLANVIPAMIGPMLVGLPASNMVEWTVLATIITVVVHSGYGITRAHDDHHKLFTCNYGAVGLLDWLHGTTYPKGKIYW